MSDDRASTEVPARVYAAYGEWHEIITAALSGNKRLTDQLITRVTSPRQVLLAAVVEHTAAVVRMCENVGVDPRVYWAALCQGYLRDVHPAPPPRVDPPS